MERMRRLVDRVARGITPRRTDTFLAIGLAFFGLLELVAVVSDGKNHHWVPSLATGITAGVAVAGRRRRPTIAIAAAFGAFAVASVSGWVANGQTSDNSLGFTAGLASLILLYSAVRYAEGGDRWWLWALGLAASALDELASKHGVPYGDLVTSTILLSAVAGTALGFRYRADLRAEREEQARAGEREQLARELHDVVAHHVSAMVVQAGAALAVLDTQPEAAREALRFIKTSGQATMGEMRHMVGILRGSDPAERAPRRGIEGLADLLVDLPGSVPVRLHQEGRPAPVDAPVDQSVQRIVQESVTNARRHARAAHAVDVTLSWQPDRLVVRIDDDGAPTSAPDHGYGLVGMAERARLVGGTFAAGPRRPGGWRVEASFPLEGAEAR